MTSYSPKIAIIGGGISGLSCAYFVQESFRQNQIPISLKVFESENHFGGSIRTQQKDGFTYESGPDTFISEKPWGVNLCKRLGLESELIGVRPEHQRSSMVYQGHLYPIPKGFYLMASPSLKTLSELPFVSWKGKLRMMLEPFIPAGGPVSGDESVAAFMRRRFGEEALWRIGQPMIGGIYTADPETLSLEATFPKFRDMERRYGSVVRGLRARADAEQGVSGPRYGLFLSFRNGMQTLIDRLRKDLGDVLCSGKKLTSLVQKAQGWELEFADGSCDQADLLCLAVTAPAAARLTDALSPLLSEALRRTPYEDAVTVNLAFKALDCPALPAGAGFVIPKIEELPLVGVTIAHQKFEGRVPCDGVLIRAFIGGVYHREVLKYNDTQLEVLAFETVRKLLRIRAKPLWTSLVRYPEAMPQFLVGHFSGAALLREQLKAFPGLFMTGNYFSGVGIPDCVHEAEKTADTMVSFFKNHFKN